MASKLKLTYYKSLLSSMHVARIHGEIIIAKPIMMLTIFKLIEDGLLIGNKIIFSKELADTYKEIYTQYRQGSITPPVYPYYYLNSEDFYYIKGETGRRTPSVKFLREKVEFAALDEELWDMLQDAEIRNELRESIVNRFLK